MGIISTSSNIFVAEEYSCVDVWVQVVMVLLFWCQIVPLFDITIVHDITILAPWRPGSGCQHDYTIQQ